MRRFLASLGSVVCTLAIASCGGGDDNDSGPASIEVTPNPVTVAQQQTSQLDVSVLDANGLLVSGVSVSFTSANTSIATVSNTGVVTGAHAGTTSIRVKASDISTNVPVTVTAVSNAIVVTPNPGVVAQKGTLQLTAVVNDINGDPMPGAPLQFSSGTATLATVSSTGLVTSVGPAGQATINIQSGTLHASVPVAITQVPTTLSIGPNPVIMGKSGSATLRVTVLDAVGTAITGLAATFTSSNTALATVSTAGVIQGKGSAGSLSIHVAAGGLTSDVPVTLLSVGSPQGVLDGTSTVSGSAYGVDVAASGEVMVTGLTTNRATLTNRTFTQLPISSQYQYAPAIAIGSNSAWISGLPDGSISEVNFTTGQVLGAVTGLPGGFYNYFMLRLSPDGSRLYASTDNILLVINTTTRSVVRTVTTTSVGLSLALNPVGSTVFVGGYGSIQEIDPATGTIRTVTNVANTNFAISPDGQFLYLVSEGDPAIRVVRVSDGAELTAIPVECNGWGIAVSPDGSRLFDSCGNNLIIVRTDTQEKQTLALDAGGELRRLAFSVDGLTAVVTAGNGNVFFIK